ncbi:hypothetical protein R3W88_004297 [Solanum pinnatisectum]|uniref:Uncharacterized protein n=1 Tax=Solanum pinnatisectum TaxID=50273 RepID=A0AAV9K8Z1_9SOLN|nr:hypothetical protein R3W88_004297 [Solanum pinnatisectum]
MADKLKEFNIGMRLVEAQNDDREKNVVRRNNLVNLETTFSPLPTTTKASSATQNICLTISPHPTSTYTISHKFTMMLNIYPPTILFPYNENKHEQLAARLYSRREKDFQLIFHEDLGKELYNMRKGFDEELRSRICQSLKYENSCVHPNIELPPAYTLPKFNTFIGK